MDTELIIRGKRIAHSDLWQIQDIINKHWVEGRTNISKELCRIWDWRQTNGIYKDQVCRILLCKLEDKGLIKLPPSKKGSANPFKRRYYTPPDPLPEVFTEPVKGSLGQFPEIQLQMVRRTPKEALWDYLMFQYHYQSYRIIVGAHLKYMAFINDRPIACLAWGSSVFCNQSRDTYIGWEQITRSQNIFLVANNARFLILPWVRIKNLASYLLARSARILSWDWLSFYGHRLYLLETFVDKSRFTGTCYKAANWIHVGKTKGHAKKRNRFYYHGQIKDVYVYPLVQDFRARLQADNSKGGAI